MSNDDIEHLDFPIPDDEDGSETTNIDPASIAHADQEQQAFQDNKEAFARTYGFVHDCHCAEDVAKGNTQDVPECFLGMATQAMGACAIYYAENKQLRSYLTQMLQMNEDLAAMVKSHGGGDDLEKYFSEEFEGEEAVAGDELQDETVGDDVDTFENEGGTPEADDGDEELTIG